VSYKVFASNRRVPKGYPDLDNALRFARQFFDGSTEESGTKVWIEYPDGTVLDHDQIDETLRRRRAELDGPPTVY
jgi:hypothetical protein